VRGDLPGGGCWAVRSRHLKPGERRGVVTGGGPLRLVDDWFAAFELGDTGALGGVRVGADVGRHHWNGGFVAERLGSRGPGRVGALQANPGFCCASFAASRSPSAGRVPRASRTSNWSRVVSPADTPVMATCRVA
jgi:hypothetical protein